MCNILLCSLAKCFLLPRNLPLSFEESRTESLGRQGLPPFGLFNGQVWLQLAVDEEVTDKLMKMKTSKGPGTLSFFDKGDKKILGPSFPF